MDTPIGEHDLSNEELVADLIEACINAGRSNSILAIEKSVARTNELAHYLIRAQYLKGKVLEKLENLSPPFHSGERVKLKEGVTSSGGWRNNVIVQGDIRIINRVFYEGKREWTLEFKEAEELVDPFGSSTDYRYKAMDFQMVPD